MASDSPAITLTPVETRVKCQSSAGVSDFASSSPQISLKTDKKGMYPTVRLVLAVLADYAIAGIILAAFLAIITVLMVVG
jgi:hypothetical protein